MYKNQFLGILRAKRTRLMENIRQMDEEAMLYRAAPDTYSIKDGLAHLTFYEQHMLNNVRGSLEIGTDYSGITLKPRTERNAEIFAQHKDRSLKGVLADMQASFAQVLAVVETIPEPILTDASRFRWLNRMPLWQYILDETSGEHYEEHLGSLMDGV